MGAELTTKEIIHYWESILTDCSFVLSITSRVMIEGTIRKLKDMEVEK
jgi:hypothetical protein